MQALITHALGARPNFMKAAPVIRALADDLGRKQMRRWARTTGT